MTDVDAVLGVLLLSLVVLLLGVVACDAARGPRSWRDWWRDHTR